jgi:hypothetical protein
MGEVQDMDSYLSKTTPELIMLLSQSDHLNVLKRLLEVYNQQTAVTNMIALHKLPRYRHTSLDMVEAGAGPWLHVCDIYDRTHVVLDTIRRTKQ